MIKYHAEGDASSPFFHSEYHQIRETLRLEKEASKRPWVTLVSTKANWHRLIVAICTGFFSQWSGNGLISYYLAKILALVGITQRSTQNKLNLGLSCWSFACTIGSSLLAAKWLRRRQLMSGYLGMTVIFTLYTACSALYAKDTNKAAGIAVIAFIFLFNAAYSLMSPFQYLYVSEIFPFIIRSKGIAVMQMSTRIAGAFNTLVNPIGLKALHWKFFIVYVVWLVVETTIVYTMFPETQGPSLEEVALVIEGDKAAVEPVLEKPHTIEERVEKI